VAVLAEQQVPDFVRRDAAGERPIRTFLVTERS
jgi:hypothetical protein